MHSVCDTFGQIDVPKSGFCACGPPYLVIGMEINTKSLCVLALTESNAIQAHFDDLKFDFPGCIWPSK